jgi:holo-[acyl-carrier protein] synthase
MQILGTGVDIIEVERIERSLARFGERFLRKHFTGVEIAYCSSKARPAQHFAARFAAKEAVIKAIGSGPRLHLHQIEISRDSAGRPCATVLDHAHPGCGMFQISMSHTHNHAVAVAIRIAT